MQELENNFPKQFGTYHEPFLGGGAVTVSYTHLRAHETRHDLVCRLLLEKKKKPFVKWVGGKRQLMQELENNFPKQFGTYH